MADPTTELAKEFLEFNNYSVRKETKFYKNKELKGTASDIDIIATSPKGIQVGALSLKRNIIAEVKSWEIIKKKTLDRIYKGKFKHIDNPEIGWKQLRRYIPSKTFDKVLFCLATTEEVYEYAMKKYGIRIVTTGLIIKHIAARARAHPTKKIVAVLGNVSAKKTMWISENPEKCFAELKKKAEKMGAHGIINVTYEPSGFGGVSASCYGIAVKLEDADRQSCPKCKKELPLGNYTYCPHCGSSLI